MIACDDNSASLWQNRAVLFGHLGVLVKGGAASTILLQHQQATHFTCCLPAFLCQQSLHTFHTLSVFQKSHFDCIYIAREIASVALIVFLMCFAFPCLFITFSKFIHVKESICGGIYVVMSLFKAIDSFNLEKLDVFSQVTYCMHC